MKIKIVSIAFGVVLVAIGKYLFGNSFFHFIENLFFRGCMDSGFCGSPPSIWNQIQALTSILFILIGAGVILAGLLYKKK